MPTHRVDLDLKGLSHYVDGGLQGKPGYQVPEGLHRERDPRRRAGKEKKIVRKDGLGMSVEWNSDGVLSVTPKENGKASDHDFKAPSQTSENPTPTWRTRRWLSRIRCPQPRELKRA